MCRSRKRTYFIALVYTVFAAVFVVFFNDNRTVLQQASNTASIAAADSFWSYRNSSNDTFKSADGVLLLLYVSEMLRASA
jgi:hypothetical protein